MTRGGFVLTAESAGSIVAVGAEYGFVIVAAEHMLSEVQKETVRPTRLVEPPALAHVEIHTTTEHLAASADTPVPLPRSGTEASGSPVK
jgi:hypothetical protein